MNIVIRDRIRELSELKTRNEKLKHFVSNWKHVAWLSVGLFTVKIASEQLAMMFIRGN